MIRTFSLGLSKSLLGVPKGFLYPLRENAKMVKVFKTKTNPCQFIFSSSPETFCRKSLLNPQNKTIGFSNCNIHSNFKALRNIIHLQIIEIGKLSSNTSKHKSIGKYLLDLNGLNLNRFHALSKQNFETQDTNIFKFQFLHPNFQINKRIPIYNSITTSI